ncbi:hypothetical protein J437_LFUL009829 [Ladona fulva]|uniref:Protein deacetylase HDAC6 n=1 Tax=Ladona fulva TaxID=123851 RepID=A0A8K0K772_LADFU|nr:hypothetical protein J437_LFUL009829 [Ladona fulva]
MATISKGSPKSKKGRESGEGVIRKKAANRAGPSAALLEAKRKAMKKGKGHKDDVIVRDVYEVMRGWKDVQRKGTAVIWDKCMLNHKALWDDNYPECPERLSSVIERVTSLGLMERCLPLSPRAVTKEEILMLHTENHLTKLAGTAGCFDSEKLEELSSHYDAVFFHPSTYEASLMAAGSTIELIDAILEGKVQNGMAIVRPPGHHAMKSQFCGYCFLNNVALAANHALCHRSRPVSKILIVDWDVHHGQATQQMFYDDPRVLYFSIHRYENGEFWPNLRESDFDFVGEGKGVGYNFNVPLNETGMGNKDYFAILQNVLMPVAYEFQPDLVLVSAGYDAALGCPEFCPELVIVSSGYDSALGDEKGEMVVTPAFYAHMTASLANLANGKIAVVLEGGYCLKSLAEGAALTLRSLLGDPCPVIEALGEPSNSVLETIENVKSLQSPYWASLSQAKKVSMKENDRKPQVYPQKESPNEPAEDMTFETRDCYPVLPEEKRLDVDAKLDSLIIGTRLTFPAERLCIVFDDRMLKHKNLRDPGHPEKPDRLFACMDRLREYGIEDRCHQLQGRLATEEELLLCHPKSHVEWLRRASILERKEMIKQEEELQSIYLHPDTYESAVVAAGSLLQVIDAVLNENCLCGVAPIRPPGHHAEPDEACGFCFFNNAAIAARYATSVHGLDRVLLLDWDVHHGNGTQHIFESDPKVLYISLHRYDNGSFFPSSKDANYTVVGEGIGKGYNVNIPWNKRGVGDTEYIYAFQQVVMPIAYEYAPQLVIVSAGFDAAVGDPLGGCRVTPEAYGHMTSWLSSLAGGKVVVVLEGGYNVTSTSLSLVACTKALLGDPLPPLGVAFPCQPHALNSIQNVVSTHQVYWPALRKTAVQQVETEVQPVSEQPNADPTQQICDALSSIDLEIATGDEACGVSASGIAAALQMEFAGEAYAVVPIRDCPHLNRVNKLPECGLDHKAPCAQCGSCIENWVCLTCFVVLCGRYVNEHMMFHGVEDQHPLTLGMADLSVWCYMCEAYIDNPVLFEARNAAHVSKFGCEIPPGQQ